jgi:1-acyl-sn-glycerol-3-phosphate acyltransferase
VSLLLRRRGESAGKPSGPDAPAYLRARVGHDIGAVVFRTIWRGHRYDGRHVPRTGPVILAANHASFMDGPLVFGMAPRPVHFIVKTEMFHGPIGLVLDTFGQIPIDRSGADRKALTTALAVLRRGDVVGIFPEGRRGRGDVQAAHAGAAWLALAAKAPVVPVAILGTRHTGQSVNGFPPPLQKVAVAFGEPVHLARPEGMSGHAATAAVTEQLRARLSQHELESSSRLGLPLPLDDASEDDDSDDAGEDGA